MTDSNRQQADSKIPLQETDFERLRSEGLIYVDKTDLLASLINIREPIFLSRPRRFGKTLLLSTLESLFSHGLTYFKGLKIEKLWQEQTTCPVLRLDFSQTGSSAASFESKLATLIKNEC